MDLTKFFFGPVSDTELHALFTLDFNEQEFAACLSTALTKGGSLELPIASIRRIFQYGVSLIEGMDLDSSSFATEQVDYRGIVPEEDLTLQSVTEGHSPSPASDGDDITSFPNSIEESDGDYAAEKHPKPRVNIDESHDLSQSIPTITTAEGTVTGLTKSQVPNKEDLLFRVSHASPPRKDSTPTESALSVEYDLIFRVCRILKVWFQGVRVASNRLNSDYAAKLFGLPGVENSLTQRELIKLLTVSRIVIERATTEYSSAFIEALKEIILLMHETLLTIFEAMAIESCNQSSNRFVVMKSLVHTFFQADLSGPLNSLLEITSPSKSQEGTEDDSSEKFDLRLSYDTLMRLYTIYYTLASCPVNLLLVDKMSLSLDITTLSEISANCYSNIIIAKDFEQPDAQYQITSRVLPLLTANFNYYYQLHPDLFNNKFGYLNVFGWIAGNRLAPVLYMSIDDIGSLAEYPEHSRVADKYNPFLYETERFEYSKKIRTVGNSKDSEYAVASPTYLLILLMMYQLVQNQSFAAYLIQGREGKAPFLDVWLCVSSYVHHYQYKSRVNMFGSRLSLLILLRLTSNERALLPILRDYKINENVWKLCRHRPSPIPRSSDAEKKSALMYIVDIIQIDLRFNLNKRLDFDNCKAALCVLYQILLFAEKNPFDGLRTYCWTELFKTLVFFITFVDKHHNEEDTKYVVEEVFSIFEIVLGPALGGIVELSSDNWIFGKHIVKTFNYELYYTILENYETLLKIFDKFIIKRENFGRVSECFHQLGESFDMKAMHNNDPNEIKEALNSLVLVSQPKPDLTHLDFAKFNHADTFKFLDKKQGYIDFQKQTELIEIFRLLYGNNWSR